VSEGGQEEQLLDRRPGCLPKLDDVTDDETLGVQPAADVEAKTDVIADDASRDSNRVCDFDISLPRKCPRLDLNSRERVAVDKVEGIGDIAVRSSPIGLASCGAEAIPLSQEPHRSPDQLVVAQA
jgi:hypothetical protein